MKHLSPSQIKAKWFYFKRCGLTTKQHDNILNFYYYYNSIIFKDINYHLLFLSFSTFGQTKKNTTKIKVNQDRIEKNFELSKFGKDLNGNYRVAFTKEMSKEGSGLLIKKKQDLK
jgi:hypothetical protein